ncbi:MAG: hypothetical protein ACRDBQ_18595 [Shewanella sp.]
MTTDTNTKADPRPQQVKGQFNKFGPEDAEKLSLLQAMLQAAGTADVGKMKDTDPKCVDAYNKLHHSFRSLMMLRGEAFHEGFTILIKAINDNPFGIFYLPRVNKNISNWMDNNEREVFIIFINMAVRFATSKDKSRFGKMNNVERLASRMADPELADAIRSVFPE